MSNDPWDRAWFAYGTARLFERRKNHYKSRLDWIAYVGLAGPLLAGGIVGVFGTEGSWLPAVLTAVGVIGIAQMLLSSFALAKGWAGELAYSAESMTANDALAHQFRTLAEATGQGTPDPFVLAPLITADEARQAQDTKHSLTQKELRFAMKHSLRHFERSCKGCDDTPTDLKPTDCSVCGDFPVKWTK